MSRCLKRMQNKRFSHASRVVTYQLCIISKADGMTHMESCRFDRTLPTGCRCHQHRSRRHDVRQLHHQPLRRHGVACRALPNLPGQDARCAA
ncbi:hypothetical protein SS58_15390 [Enterobacter hormaechei subsp. hoffmannii]|nr:hypothetical protein SS58_15390 [Enterobacter hormaechei subsp. hoffmannii]